MVKRTLPLPHYSTNFGWTETDASHSFTNARVTSADRLQGHSQHISGPEVAGGEVYQVHYDRPLSWTRHSRTNTMYGPGTKDWCSTLTKLNYAWKDVRTMEAQFAAGANYMFVLGPVNYTQTRQFLVLFYNPCTTLDAPHKACTPASLGVDEPTQGVWLPAVYSPDTGVLFSEIGEAQVHGRRDVLGWTSRSRVQSVMQCSSECGTTLTMSQSEVTANRLTDNDLVASARASLLHPIITYLVGLDGGDLLQFADLTASVPPELLGQAKATVATSFSVTDAKPVSNRFDNTSLVIKCPTTCASGFSLNSLDCSASYECGSG